ncbi:hypothetical protein TNCV_1773731 [Trichonephila clavipes]|nr:hypothetical protein TNCV_1773731 [Trichonephila clavipes]
MAEIVNGVYGADTVTANYMQIWFRRFRLGIFDVKIAPRTGRPVIKNVGITRHHIDKILSLVRRNNVDPVNRVVMTVAYQIVSSSPLKNRGVKGVKSVEA